MSKNGLSELMDGIDEVLRNIPKATKDRENMSGNMPCPVCKIGTIKWVRVPYNNHIRMGCSTPACIMMMQ